MNSPDHLSYGRVALRPYHPDNAADIWAAVDESRHSLAMWIPDIARRQTVAEVTLALHQVEEARLRKQSALFGIWRTADRLFVGEVGLHDLDLAAGSATVGYWLRPSARGQGYVDEALSALHRFASVDLGLTKIEAHIAVENAASRRVAVRNGYLLRGTRTVDPEWDGNATGILIYARRISLDGVA
jgi:ribosomal-protein-serine acetyltransferase